MEQHFCAQNQQMLYPNKNKCKYQEGVEEARGYSDPCLLCIKYQIFKTQRLVYIQPSLRLNTPNFAHVVCLCVVYDSQIYIECIPMQN
jgi:hypothetical protein